MERKGGIQGKRRELKTWIISWRVESAGYDEKEAQEF